MPVEDVFQEGAGLDSPEPIEPSLSIQNEPVEPVQDTPDPEPEPSKPAPDFATREDLEKQAAMHQAWIAQQEAQRQQERQAQAQKEQMSEADQRIAKYYDEEMGKIELLAANNRGPEALRQLTKLSETMAQIRMRQVLPDLIQDAVNQQMGPIQQLAQQYQSEQQFRGDPELVDIHHLAPQAVRMEAAGVPRHEIIQILRAASGTTSLQKQRQKHAGALENPGSGAPPARRAVNDLEEFSKKFSKPFWED